VLVCERHEGCESVEIELVEYSNMKMNRILCFIAVLISQFALAKVPYTNEVL
jgi:hypothetical protein